MTGKDDSLQSISTVLDGKNYMYWSNIMKNFLRGKNMWSYVTWTKANPLVPQTENFDLLLDAWETDNSKLAKYDTTKEVWNHLERLHTQSNFAKQYQLEYDIHALQQNDQSIQDFYAAMSDLWDQLVLTESKELKDFEPYISRREEHRLVQFLMALRFDCKGLRGIILHLSPLPSVDFVVRELIVEETCIKSHANIGFKETSIPPPAPVVLVVSSNQSRQTSRVTCDECALCKQKIYWKAQCPLLVNKGKSGQP
ncbi:uncharacterized protein LOC111920316 [Lactuca sativa]|uniref:uncharacterized protein LOC111920316 n=1 Tax=Lactuca sativa TaxID=4236 RepID=UPI000CD8B66E|nr:uncharacterized protein LOC111920316 [Lactuca sativa]